MSVNENLKEYDELKKKHIEKSNNKWKINRPFYQMEYIIKHYRRNEWSSGSIKKML